MTLDRGQARAARRAELGYVIARGFHYLDVNRIEAFVDPANVGSVRVLEKAGLVREAHLRSYVVHRGKIKDRYVYAKTQS